ncbi:hypothetical protein ACJX0J_038317, partial [Zea mays]
ITGEEDGRATTNEEDGRVQPPDAGMTAQWKEEKSTRAGWTSARASVRKMTAQLPRMRAPDEEEDRATAEDAGTGPGGQRGPGGRRRRAQAHVVDENQRCNDAHGIGCGFLVPSERERVVDYYEDGEWNIDLKRPLTIVDLQVWDELVTKLVDQELTHGRDE